MSVSPRSQLGASLALTGPEAPYGRQLLAALELAVADAAGVTLYVEDDEGDPSAAQRAAERLAASDALAVVGPMNSWTCEVQGPIFAEAELVQVTPSASNPQLSRRGWSTFFRACPSDERQAEVLARVALHLVGAARVAAVHDCTSFAAPLAARFAEYATGLGLQVTAIAGITSDPGSLQALKAVVESRPDAILVAGLEAECASAAGGLRARGCEAILLGTDAGKPTHTLRTAGFSAPYLTNSATDAIREAPEFHRRLIERCGAHDSVYTVETYDVARHMATWVATHPNATRRGVLAAIRIPFHGLVGPYAFDADGERRAATIGVYRDDDGGLRFLGTDRDVLPS